MLGFDNRYYTGVELHKFNSESVHATVCRIIKKGREFSIHSIHELEGTWNQFAEHIKNSKRLTITVNTKQVLSKTLEHGQNISTQEQFNAILPTEKSEKFYIQQINGAQATTHVSIVRKNGVDEIVECLRANKIFPEAIFIGPNILGSLLPLIEQKLICTTSHLHKIDQQLITHFELNEQPLSQVSLFDRLIDSSEVLSVSAALLSLFPSQQIESISYDNEAEIAASKKFSHWTEKLAKSAAVLLLCILLVNFLVFTQQRSQHAELIAENSMYEDQITVLKAYNLQHEERVLLLKENPWLSTSKTSFFCDRIMAVKPLEIEVLEANLFPINDEDELTFFNDQIVIVGKTDNSRFLNNWIKKIRNYDWVNAVEVTSLQENRDGNGEFELRLKLKS